MQIAISMKRKYIGNNYTYDSLPKSLLVSDKEYRIKTDFRTWIKFENILKAPDIDSNIKLFRLIELVKIDDMKGVDQNELINALFSFYLLGKKERKIPVVLKQKGNDVAYNFREDWNLIYSAFMSQYGIDLFVSDFHWWQFKALFDGLKDTRFNDIEGYRSADTSKLKDEIKKDAEALKTYYSLKSIENRKSAKERIMELQERGS